MTDLRTAAQQALEALEEVNKSPWLEDCYHAFDDEVTALRAALAEPEDAALTAAYMLGRHDSKWCPIHQHYKWCEHNGGVMGPTGWEKPVQQGCDHCNQPLYAAIKCRVCGRVTEPVQEPVAWIHTDPDKRRVKFLEWRENEPGYRGDWIKTPLYTAPPQRKPEPNSDYERGFVDGMSEQARRSVDKAVNAMTNCKPLAEEEIARLVTNDMVKFARAIERAHGITP